MRQVTYLPGTGVQRDKLEVFIGSCLNLPSMRGDGHTDAVVVIELHHSLHMDV